MTERDRELAAEILAVARARDATIATAESCTGGLVGAALTAIPGSSDIFDRGFVTYSYAAKSDLLRVPSAMLRDHGAVSEPVARQMAEGALAASYAGFAVAITGVAGPGASESKPEGLVWFATAGPLGTEAEVRRFGALGRDRVRGESVTVALALLLARLRNDPQAVAP
ncbi:MAG: CinA family protein [Pseudomonadota bacterium]